MSRSAVRCAAVLSVCGSAFGAPFQALSYEAGGGLPGIAGQGFSVDFGGFFVADGAGTNVTPGGTGSFNDGNEYQVESYFALDGFGPSARNRGDGCLFCLSTTSFYGDYGPPGGPGADYNVGELIPGYFPIVGPGSHIGDDLGDGDQPENIARAGIGVAPPPVRSHFAPNATGGRSAFDGVFVGRFTIKESATLSGGILFHSLVSFGVFDSHDLVLGGDPVLFQTSSGPQLLALRAYQIPPTLASTIDLQNPSAATAEGVNIGTPFGLAKVLDLWVQVVPGPGVVMVLGPLFLMRRRKRS